MISLLILDTDKKRREQYAMAMCQKEKIDTLDIMTITVEENIGVEDVRTIQKKLFLKPLKSQQKALLITNAHTATTEAQNALLKILEEPPKNTIVILTAVNEHAFLPTILSRCKIIKLEENNESLSQEEMLNLQKELTYIVSAPIGTKLKYAQNLAKDKEKAIEWLKMMIRVSRFQMLEDIEKTEQVHVYFSLLQSLQKTHVTAASTNINLRFLLEQTFLDFE